MGSFVRKVGIGIIGCGNISSAYLTAARNFPVLDIRAVADLDLAAAQRRGEEFAVPAATIAELLADPAIEIVVNLTIPNAHVAVSHDILKAGKHSYSEKPLGVAFAEAAGLAEEAERRGLRLGCAPDTFLGGSHQTAREVLDGGRLGTPIGGTAFFMCPGHERWHPNPDFYYKIGGGPVLDMAPYYVTDLVNLLGPVARVAAMAPKPRPLRTITSEPRSGETIEVEVPTHVSGSLEFQSGAVVAITMSFDVPGHRHLPLEIYGTEGSLIVPDPNWFGGEVVVSPQGRRVAGRAGGAAVDGGPTSLHRARGHGGGDPAGPAAPGFGGAGAARARGDGGSLALGGDGPLRRNRHPAGTPAAAGRGRAAGPAGLRESFA